MKNPLAIDSIADINFAKDLTEEGKQQMKHHFSFRPTDSIATAHFSTVEEHMNPANMISFGSTKIENQPKE